MDPAFSELEEAFFREGEEICARNAAAAEGAVVGEVIEISSHVVGRDSGPEDPDYYASLALTIETDEVSGGFEVAA